MEWLFLGAKAAAQSFNHADGFEIQSCRRKSVSVVTCGAMLHYLDERVLREGSHGEIVNTRGRTVFEVGFARAIRKVLEG
ncbi:MAG: hypothetical protein WBQ69_13400 [Gallionella sp.]